MIGKRVSIKFPTNKFSWEVADCKINKETEKAVHIVRGVSSSTAINHKCSFGELNLFLFFFVRGQNIKIKL
jgi:hypothetical protein